MISVIVSIYNRLDNLDIIFDALNCQTFRDFEVIVSEDNNAERVRDFVDSRKIKYSFPIKHVSQEDKGFRKTKILNQAVLAAAGEYIVFLDGDCVPERHWMEEYSKHLAPNRVCFGRRCYLDEKYTGRILAKGRLRKLSPNGFLFHIRRREQSLRLTFLDPGKSERLILGCNWGVDKNLLFKVNGFDEDYELPGIGEDHDIDLRLRKAGAEFINLRHSVIVYHMYHKANYSKDATLKVKEQWKEKKKLNLMKCKNGIVKNLL